MPRKHNLRKQAKGVYVNPQFSAARHAMAFAHDCQRPARLTSAVQSSPLKFLKANWLFIVGLFAIAIPTMAGVAKFSWGTESGAHGPIVVATGVWLFLRRWHLVAEMARPLAAIVLFPVFAALLVLYYLSSVTHILEVNGYAMYGLLVAGLASFVGISALRKVSFPLFYMLFAFPPPESLVAMVTQPLKVWISETAVMLLYECGYPVASSGVMIQVGQYQLLVAAACSGLNSLISLSAISMFYIYMRHRLDWGYNALMLCVVVPVAIFANMVRVLILILLTYHAGEATAQGFFHEFAGVTMFVTAVVTIFTIDKIARPLWLRRHRKASNGVA